MKVSHSPRTLPITDPLDRPGNAEDANHYVPRWQITESIVTGRPVTALCGETFVVQGEGEGSTRDTHLPVCLDCDFIYSGLPAESEAHHG